MLGDAFEHRHAEIVDLVRRSRDVQGPMSIEFQPVGEDSWNYRVESYWVSVRRDFSGFDARSYACAAELMKQGHSFVLAPTDGHDELVDLSFGLPVVISGYVDVIPFGPDDAVVAETLVRRLHALPPFTEVGSEEFSSPWSAHLPGLVAEVVDAGCSTGPKSASLRTRVAEAEPAISTAFDEWTQLALGLAADPSPLVLTHGDASRHNFGWLDGQPVLLDWGAVGMAPPERDWCALRRSFVSQDIPVGRARFMRFYDLKWWLGETYEYLVRFVAEHRDTVDDDAAWGRLGRALDELRRITADTTRGTMRDYV